MVAAEPSEIKYQHDDGLFVALQSTPCIKNSSSLFSPTQSAILSQGTSRKDQVVLETFTRKQQFWLASTQGTLGNSQHPIIHKFHLRWKVLGLFGGHSDSPAFFHSQAVTDATAGGEATLRSWAENNW